MQVITVHSVNFSGKVLGELLPSLDDGPALTDTVSPDLDVETLTDSEPADNPGSDKKIVGEFPSFR